MSRTDGKTDGWTDGRTEKEREEQKDGRIEPERCVLHRGLSYILQKA